MSRRSRSRIKRGRLYVEEGNPVNPVPGTRKPLSEDEKEENRIKKFKSKIKKYDNYYDSLNSLNILIEEINHQINIKLNEKDSEQLLLDEIESKNQFYLNESRSLNDKEHELNKLAISEEEKLKINKKVKVWERAISNVLSCYEKVITIGCNRLKINHSSLKKEFSLSALIKNINNPLKHHKNSITEKIWFNSLILSKRKGIHPYFRANFYNINKAIEM